MKLSLATALHHSEEVHDVNDAPPPPRTRPGVLLDARAAVG